jgi:ribosome-associated protein
MSYKEIEHSKRLAIDIGKIALQKKAQDLEIIDLSNRVDYTDYLVILTASSDRHALGIANTIQINLKNKNILLLGLEGISYAQWILMDYGRVIVHIFTHQLRRYYDLESLWIDANRLDINKI